MPIINRISRLFTADLHAVLDRIEEPEVLLKQAIREMDEAVAASEQRIAQLRREHDQWTARSADIATSLDDLDEQLDVCFASDEEVLARALIKRKLETERLAKHIGERRDALAEALQVNETQLVDNRDSLDALREKAELLIEQPSANDQSSVLPGARPVGDDEVDIAFLREKQRRSAS
jgi:phage shock protein A